MIYLASPYTGSELQEANRASNAFSFVRAHLAEGLPVFSPIVYTAGFVGSPGHFEAWQFLNDSAIRHASEVWVLCLDGWQTSRGVTHELALARSLGKPIRYFNPEGEEINADR